MWRNKRNIYIFKGKIIYELNSFNHIYFPPNTTVYIFFHINTGMNSIVLIWENLMEILVQS